MVEEHVGIAALEQVLVALESNTENFGIKPELDSSRLSAVSQVARLKTSYLISSNKAIVRSNGGT